MASLAAATATALSRGGDDCSGSYVPQVADGPPGESGTRRRSLLETRRRITQPATRRTMTTPINALRMPPQSNTSSSPIPSPAVKISQPRAAPTRPSNMDTSQDFGPLMPANTSFGTSTRPMNPATNPRSSAPTTSHLLSMHPHRMRAIFGDQIYELDDAVVLALHCCFPCKAAVLSGPPNARGAEPPPGHDGL